MSAGDFDWKALAPRYEAGETYEEIGLDLGVSANTVGRRLRPFITPRPKGERVGVPRRKNDARARSEGRGVAPVARIARPSVARMYR